MEGNIAAVTFEFVGRGPVRGRSCPISCQTTADLFTRLGFGLVGKTLPALQQPTSRNSGPCRSNAVLLHPRHRVAVTPRRGEYRFSMTLGGDYMATVEPRDQPPGFTRTVGTCWRPLAFGPVLAGYAWDRSDYPRSLSYGRQRARNGRWPGMPRARTRDRFGFAL